MASTNYNLCSEVSPESTPGCFDRSCEDRICRFRPECCTVDWDEACATAAQNICQPEIIPRTSSVCPLGYICTGTEMASCQGIQDAMLNLYKVGDIYGGIYCPERYEVMVNCPVGSYCSTPDERLPCPEGYFCPHKSRLYDGFVCRQCGEGAEERPREIIGYVVIGILAFLAIAFIVLGFIKRYRKDLFLHLRDLQQRKSDGLRIALNRKKRYEQLERIKPKLEIIASRLAKLASSSSSNAATESPLIINDGKIKFNAQRMFEVLDTNNDGVLTYNEINQVLRLNNLELKEFVLRMNELDRTTDDHPELVSKSAFSKYFAQVLEEAINFTCSPGEAGRLFDEIIADASKKNKKNDRDGTSESPEKVGVDSYRARETLPADKLYSSPISNFLTEPQIHALIKKFRNSKTNSKKAKKRRGRSDSETSSFGRKTSLKFSTVNITREEFILNYPRFLIEVTNPVEEENGIEIIPKSSGVDIAFKNLSLAVKVGDASVNVVDDLTGRICSNTMVALMGGSGAGKSSLLNALCGRAHYGETTGTIYINGKEAPIDTIRDRVGFVPQDDIVYAELTVRENFVFSGRFRLPKHTHIQDIEDLADETLANLGLSRVANSIVGDVKRRGVSGGEKKRVNIGLELMALPEIVFLDEPTSGLDSSSALVVMESMKHLIEARGVTVVCVIHQPRKFIFDLFDSLILLGVGGKMVYHGLVNQAQAYFEVLGYTLPPGENIADWFIDISTGRLESQANILDDSEDTSKFRKKKKDSRKEKKDSRTRPSVVPVGNKGSKGSRGISTGKQNQSMEEAKIRRQWLYDQWNMHFKDLNDTATAAKLYMVPQETPLPVAVRKASFLSQLWVQLKRAYLVSLRNSFSKFIDTCIVLGALIIISLIDGVEIISYTKDPIISFMDATRPTKDSVATILRQLFKYAVVEQQIEYPLKIGLVVAVLLGLQSTKITTSKRVEFFREASTTDINAYFVALNIVATLEHAIEILVASLFAAWLRNPVTSWASYIINFQLLSWISVSWGLFFPQVIPAENVTVVVGFFFTFFCLLFSGPLDPIKYDDIYGEGNWAALLSGWLSPTRYFIEGLAVGEYRCMPAQSGWTVDGDTLNFPRNLTSLSAAHLAGNDINATLQSCYGWYWSVGPAIMVGLTIRLAAGGAMHGLNRDKQIKKPLRKEMRSNQRFRIVVILYSIVLLGMICVTSWMIVRVIPPAPSIAKAEEHQAEVNTLFGISF